MDLRVEDFELDAKVFYNQTGQVLYILDQTRGVVEKWTRQRNIGIGGYGQVFLEQSDSGKLRAVKEVKISGDSSDHMKELRPMAGLSRDKDLFVQLIGWFTSERYIYIAMEYLHLGDIRACYEDPLSEPEVKDVGKQLLEGLEKMHKMRITHRDIKPKNILVVQKFPIWVKIADFGISKGDGSALQTVIGTQGFMAPEILGSKNPEYTNAVDVWSLGCVLYFLLTKDEPFPKLWQLFQYERGEIGFPEDNLNARNVSVAGIEFIKGLMKVEPLDRMLVSDALNDPWIRDQSQSAQFLLQSGFDINAVGFNVNLAVLLAAAKDHRGDVVRLLLRNGANVAAKTALLWTALHLAADRGHGAVVRLLLEKEADVAAKTALLWTALHLAANRGHEAVVRLLLEKKADVAAKTALLWTALHLAADGGHEAVVRLLLEKGADVAAKTTLLWTALHLAADRGHEAVVRLLLEKGADVAVRTYDGHTALHRAAENGHEAVVRLLLKEGGDIEAKTNDGRTALYMATGSGHEAAVRLLVEKRTDVKDLSARKWLASAKLFGAAKNGNEVVVRQMLKQGVDIEAETNDGGTALHRAAESGHEGVVRLLLEEGADVEAKTYTGWTALHGAAGSGHKTVVQLLLNKGADVEAKTYTGWTALHGAARSGQEAVVQLLLSKGADVAAKTYTGWTALREAARSGHEAMVQLLTPLTPDS